MKDKEFVLQLLFPKLLSPPKKKKMDEFNFFQFLNDDNEILQLKTNIPWTFPLFVYVLVNILAIFYLLKLKIHAIPSPPSQQRTKKIKSHHKS